MSRIPAADDFKAIRLRMEELRRERAQTHEADTKVEPRAREPDAAAHVPRRTRLPIPSSTRRPGSV
jgi:hypothetical protein